MGVAMLAHDSVGPITDRMCLRCEHFVYINDQPAVLGYRPDCFVFLCLWCMERLLPIECESQRHRDYLSKFLNDLGARRMELAQAKRIKKVEEQQSLWD